MNDSHVHDEYGHMTETIEDTLKLKHRLMKKLDLMKDDLLEPEYIGPKGASEVFIGWGSTAMSLREVVERVNENPQAHGATGPVAALLFTDVFPVPEKKLREVVATGAVIINVEQNYNNQFGKLMRAETGLTYHKTINKYDGRPITADDIIDSYLRLEGKEVHRG